MPQPVLVEVVSDAAHAADVAAIAAATFPLACPPHSRPEDIAGHIRDNLRPEVFAHHIESTESDVLVARAGIGGRIVGYALAVHTAPEHPDVAAVVTQRPVTEISKMYVAPEHHASGQQTPPSHALMHTALEIARGRGSMLAWLGVNQENVRAQRFYTKMGFVRAGVKTFDLHGSVEHDFIFVHQL
ncbi:GNAT family N-acetyltransferase [Gordonia mangrovi]|uniref:GNAT family N-acetyltransferase n=1 Tax=Gordonia mangrovi TaxID=2665643 RepID=UPI0021AC37D8|nr:GNAT family N-acetyltransferase [Gordonia mangrovi]UVF77787.1 GNAT family N-acetyltransferase [Gordonia mangrovi]